MLHLEPKDSCHRLLKKQWNNNENSMLKQRIRCQLVWPQAIRIYPSHLWCFFFIELERFTHTLTHKRSVYIRISSHVCMTQECISYTHDSIIPWLMATSHDTSPLKASSVATTEAKAREKGERKETRKRKTRERKKEKKERKEKKKKKKKMKTRE